MTCDDADVWATLSRVISVRPTSQWLSRLSGVPYTPHHYSRYTNLLVHSVIFDELCDVEHAILPNFHEYSRRVLYSLLKHRCNSHTIIMNIYYNYYCMIIICMLNT